MRYPVTTILAVLLLLCHPTASTAENYLLNGEQSSLIRYRSIHRIQPAGDTRSVTLSYVIPQAFESATYRQTVGPIDIQSRPEAATRRQDTDPSGNQIVELHWPATGEPVTAELSFEVRTGVQLDNLVTTAPFPPEELPESVRRYLKPTDQVPAQDPKVVELAGQLTADARTEFDAVQQVLTWIVDHLRYVLTPEAPDALYSLATGKGNCQNYSHLAAALMRAVGIPVRIVNGFTLKKPYDITIGGEILTMKMAQGRHSWIEVYFPDLGWVPFDPQGSEMFVSNRFLRVEVGLDNAETIRDGLLRWTRVKGAAGRPEFVEEIEARFESDTVAVSATRANYGPREILLCPRLEAMFKEVKRPAPPPPPEKIPKDRLLALSYIKPLVLGNLDFPEGVDFLSGLQPAGGENQEIRRNFLVETAEYVTTRGQQYAQTFIVDRPLKLENVALALHRFNEEGQLWLELLEDAGGVPAAVIATSELKTLSEIPFSPGYAWVGFDFTRNPVYLSPGRYWIALGFTGAPIVNWFFTYGKPEGPEDGTRYRTIFDETWSRSLSYEFNYRVAGKTP
ncbi:MAG: transglutaminase-like domain-containing protein [Desulfobacterales bacterium]